MENKSHLIEETKAQVHTLLVKCAIKEGWREELAFLYQLKARHNDGVIKGYSAYKLRKEFKKDYPYILNAINLLERKKLITIQKSKKYGTNLILASNIDILKFSYYNKHKIVDGINIDPTTISDKKVFYGNNFPSNVWKKIVAGTPFTNPTTGKKFLIPRPLKCTLTYNVTDSTKEISYLLDGKIIEDNIRWQLKAATVASEARLKYDSSSERVMKNKVYNYDKLSSLSSTLFETAGYKPEYDVQETARLSLDKICKMLNCGKGRAVEVKKFLESRNIIRTANSIKAIKRMSWDAFLNFKDSHPNMFAHKYFFHNGSIFECKADSFELLKYDLKKKQHTINRYIKKRNEKVASEFTERKGWQESIYNHNYKKECKHIDKNLLFSKIDYAASKFNCSYDYAAYLFNIYNTLDLEVDVVNCKNNRNKYDYLMSVFNKEDKEIMESYEMGLLSPKDHKVIYMSKNPIDSNYRDLFNESCKRDIDGEYHLQTLPKNLIPINNILYS